MTSPLNRSDKHINDLGFEILYFNFHYLGIFFDVIFMQILYNDKDIMYGVAGEIDRGAGENAQWFRVLDLAG